MNNQVLADYYEEKYLIKKAQRLRNHKYLMFYGSYSQYSGDLGKKYHYGTHKGNGWWFLHGSGEGYHIGNGSYYRC